MKARIMTRRPRNSRRSTKPPVVRANLIDQLSTDHNPQLASPLFSLIPAEIRNEIFALALIAFDDESQPYKEDTYYCRPGYRHKKRITISLLSTCRRVYVETYLLPVAANEHVFWCYRGPPNGCSNPKSYFLKMSDKQKDAVKRVHFFTQLYWLEGTFQEDCTREVMRPKSIMVTIRHSDWWFWEHNTKLRMEKTWGYQLKNLVGLEELVVELETMNRDEDQLEAIAKKMKSWTFDLHDGRILSAEGNDIVRYRWLGPSCFEGSLRYSKKSDTWISGKFISSGLAPLVYRVLRLKWAAVRA